MGGVSFYNIAIPALIRNLKIVSGYLQKAQKYADEKGMPYSKVLEAKLVEDMYNFTFQVQTVKNSAKGVAVRVGGIEPFVIEDDEKTFDQLEGNIQKVIAVLEKVDKATMDKNEHTEVVIKTPFREYKWEGLDYVLEFALPNFYFHMTMIHALLRQLGVPVGKMDFLGSA